MLIYNETFIIDEAIKEDWLNWIREHHIPAIMATGAFDEHSLFTVLDSPNEGFTFCLQFKTDSVERYSDFYYKHLEAVHSAHNKQFEEQFALFHTLMEQVAI